MDRKEISKEKKFIEKNCLGAGQAVCPLLWAGRAEEPRGGDQSPPGGDPGGRHPTGQPSGPGGRPAQHCSPRDSHRIHQ
jgi:hypothetical protein